MNEATPAAQPVQDSTPVEVETSQPSTDTNQDDAQDSPAGESQQSDTDKRIAKLQQRLDRVTADRHTWVGKAKEYEEKWKSSQTAQPDGPKPPKEEDFANVEDYYKAVGKFEAAEENRKQQTESKRKEETEKREADNKRVAQGLEKKAAEYSKTNPRFEENLSVFQSEFTLADQNAPAYHPFRDALVTSDNPPALMNYLGENPDEMTRILGLSNAPAVFRAFSQIEAKLASPAEDEPEPIKQVSAPPRPIGGTGKPSKPLEKRSPQEVVEWVRKK